MTIKNFPFLLSVFLLLSCSQKKQESGIIKADISKLTTDFDKVVINMWGDEALGDSIKTFDTIPAKEGKFEYHFKVREPKHAYIYFLKNNKKVATLGFKDKSSKKQSFWGDIFLGNENIEFNTDSVYEIIEFKGLKSYRVNFEGSPEAEMFMKGWKEPIISNKNIKQNASNFALLYKLFWSKEQYSVNQLREYSSLFSDEIKKSVPFNMLTDYIDNKEKIEKFGFRENFNWVDIDNKNYTFDQVSNGKPVLLVFWASWCGPCRKEIPELKKFHNDYKDKINIVSLSIDDKYDNWKTAVEKENMPWLNLSGLPKSNNAIKKEYNIFAVPNLILLNKDGKVLLNAANDLSKIINTIDKTTTI